MKKQSGSAHVIIVIILVLALLGSLGFIFWQNFINKKTDTTTPDKGTSKVATKEEQDKKLPISASWFVYESENKKFTMALPDGWILMSSRGSDGLYAFNPEDISFKSGVPARVNVVDNGGDGVTFSLVYGYKNNQNFDLSYQLGKSKKIKTYSSKNGVAVDKYSRTQTSEPEGMDIAKGTVEYIYELSKDSASAVIIYDLRPGEVDQTQYIEESIDTLRFL